MYCMQFTIEWDDQTIKDLRVFSGRGENWNKNVANSLMDAQQKTNTNIFSGNICSVQMQQIEKKNGASADDDGRNNKKC